MKKRSLVIMGHATSVSMEEEFWTLLKRIAEQKKCTVQQLVEQIDISRQGNLSSAIRIFVLNYLLESLPKEAK